MITVVTFADLGDRRNLKTADIAPIIETFSEKGEPFQVFCRIAVGDTPKFVKGMLPLWVHYVISLLGRVTFGVFPTRKLEEMLCDLRSSYLLKNESIVVIHSLSFFRTIDSAKQKGIQVIGIATTAHSLFVEKQDDEELDVLNTSRIRRSVRFATRYLKILSKLDLLVCLSQYAADTFVRSGFPQDRIRVAELDVDTERFSPDETNRTDEFFSVLFPAASIGILKGIQYLLDVWSSVDVPNKRMVILGKFMGWPREVLARYQRQMDADPTITIAGFSSIPEKYFKEADIVVFPTFTEGFSRSIAEAMASGVPVITTPAGQGLLEDGQTGFIVPERDSRAIKEKIEYLYSHREERIAMGVAARETMLHKRSFGEAIWDVCKELQDSNTK